MLPEASAVFGRGCSELLGASSRLGRGCSVLGVSSSGVGRSCSGGDRIVWRTVTGSWEEEILMDSSCAITHGWALVDSSILTTLDWIPLACSRP